MTALLRPSDRPVLGVALMMGFCVAAPLADAAAKILAGTFPVLQLVLARFAAQVAVLVPLALATRRTLALSRRGWMLTALRAVLQIAGIFLMISALRVLPLAEAIAIAFVMPFVLLLLGHVLLGETVGPHRLLACAVGFGGTLLVMQPTFAEAGWAVLLPLGVAVVFALFILATRALAREADPVAMQADAGIVALALLGAGYALGGGPLVALAPVGGDWPLLLLMGLLGTLGHLMMTWSLRFAPAATLAPMQYVEIPVAALVGLWLFGDWPDPLANLGIAVTVATGLYILWREARAAPEAAPARAPTP
ncbi:DMT family transporter [Jannaschia sp. W003]|uniref:DMT family transporter n=1 Tax=Jannaschia sp. W003 TaxID=2867012 RepID=UPI0021A280E4|nr:DMT family transporter [Jannaschia sp. W003]UWQ20556.1 DMT family transporter [Jannaschia sp. W003]